MVTAMSIEDELQRQKNINLHLRRQLERCRRDVVEHCAKFCESHEVAEENGDWYIVEMEDGSPEGKAYADGLRGMIKE
jgi:hypothetical protein